MQKFSFPIIVLAWFVLGFFISSAVGAPLTQSFNLKDGWNAIYLEVEPTDSDPAAVFAGISPQLVSVWKWNANAGTVEFIQNPDELQPANSIYQTYLPGNAILTNLNVINGNSAYLVKTSAACTLAVTGEALMPKIEWKANSYNLVGFHLRANYETTFSSFFASCPEFHTASGELADIYGLDDSGRWQKASTTDMMLKGEAFWIYCRGSSQFTGTVRVQVEQNRRLDFGDLLSFQDIVITNLSEDPQRITLHQSSATVPLYYQLPPTADKFFTWNSFAEDYTGPELAPGTVQRLRVGVRRSRLTAGTSYESNLELLGSIASKGSAVTIPVSVTGVDFSGLWIGNVTLNKVNEIHSKSGDNTVTPQKTGSEFTFRIILHNDGHSTRILNRVVEIWSDTRNEFIFASETGYLQEGHPVGRRFSAPAFGNFSGGTGSQLMTTIGDGFGVEGTTLSTTIELAADDSLNPFVHRYNHEHATVNDYDIRRSLTLTFGGGENGGDSFIGWGSTEVGGTYEESLTGLTRQTINVKGTFRLRKISAVKTLNGG